MKNTSRIVLAIAVIVGVCVLVAVLIITQPESGEEQAVTESVKPKFIIDDGSSWPMFRGERGLTGRASGTLPDSLAVVWKFKTNDSIKSSPAIVGDLVS